MVDMAQLLEQMKSLQANMGKLQTKVASRLYRGESGGGMVAVELDGTRHPKTITLDPSLLKPDNAQLIADLIIEAIRVAKEEAEADSSNAMAEMLEQFGIPKGMKLPF